MKITPLAALVAVLSIGCQQPRLSDVREDAEKAIESARTRAGEIRELSAEELQDLWAIEYTSLTLPRADPDNTDDLLNEMGQERWDCYHVSENEQERTFYFKRNKSNLTAHLTNLLRLGAIAF